MASERAAGLASRLQEAADQPVGVLESVDEESWGHVPGPGTWSIGREAEHVAEAGEYQPTRPPRAKGQRLGETIERVLIGHYDMHLLDIERRFAGRETKHAG